MNDKINILASIFQAIGREVGPVLFGAAINRMFNNPDNGMIETHLEDFEYEELERLKAALQTVEDICSLYRQY